MRHGQHFITGPQTNPFAQNNFKQKQLRLLRPYTECPCLNRAVIITNRLTARGRERKREEGRQGGGLSDRAETTLLLCLDWRGVWHLANLNQKTITHGQGKLFATRNWLPDKRFYIPTYLFLSFCAKDLLMCNPGAMARMRLELKLKLRLRLEGKQKQDLCIVA